MLFLTDAIPGLEVLTGNITALIMILTLLSLLLANLARMIQASHLGIPLKVAQQATIPDSLDIWIVLVSMLGLCLFAPWLLMTSTLASWVIIPLTFSCIFLGAISVIPRDTLTRTNPSTSITKNITYHIISQAALGTAIFTAVIHFIRNLESPALPLRILLWVSFFFIALHVGLVLYALYGALYLRLFGRKDLMTITINEQDYLLAMKHSSTQWIILPANIVINPDTMRHMYFIVFHKTGKTICVTKGKFIIRDMSELVSTCCITCRKDFRIQAEEPTIETA